MIYDVGLHDKELLEGIDKVRQDIEDSKIEGLIVISVGKSGDHGHYLHLGRNVSMFEWIGTLEILKRRLLEKVF